MMEQPKGGNRSRKYSGKRRGKKRKEEEEKKELAIAIMQKTKDNMANGYTPHYE